MCRAQLSLVKSDNHLVPDVDLMLKEIASQLRSEAFGERPCQLLAFDTSLLLIPFVAIRNTDIDKSARLQCISINSGGGKIEIKSLRMNIGLHFCGRLILVTGQPVAGREPAAGFEYPENITREFVFIIDVNN